MSEPSAEAKTHAAQQAGEVPAGEAAPAQNNKDYEEFEVGEHQVPWFLWVFFLLIVSWASVSWIKFFNY
ncbi:MAG: hypothetical protein VKJ04_02840 [Vampirovibrionales bacterium]|nr:hypothetical protein [Vampirovibrionales bacterium]